MECEKSPTGMCRPDLDEVRTISGSAWVGPSNSMELRPTCRPWKGDGQRVCNQRCCGKADVMMVQLRSFLYLPLLLNSDGYIAALKTIEILERDHVLDDIWGKGGRFKKRIEELIAKYDVGAELTGVAPMFYITFKKDQKETIVPDATILHPDHPQGRLFAPAHHGYICYRHTQQTWKYG